MTVRAGERYDWFTMMRIYLILALMLATGCASEAPAITFVGADARVQADVLAAAARFEAVGLELSAVTVEYDGELCSGGADGYYFEGRVTLCEGYAAFVPTHELAHAWIDVRATAETRQAFMDLRGWDEWAEAGVSWQERAFEDAAFVVQQGVDLPASDRVSAELLNRAAAFTALTGVVHAEEG